MTDLAALAQQHDASLDDLVAKLDLSQKVRLLTGESHWGTHGEAAIGLRPMVLSDGPVGVRGSSWDDSDPSACFPSPTAMAASWDRQLIASIGSALAGEAHRKGVDVLLAPAVNLQRSPLAGRHFECWSEDPLLTGTLSAALVRAVQRHGVAATVKHYVANDSETERYDVDVRLDQRALREIYLAPFEQVVRESEPWLVMASYNAVNGTTMTEHPLLEDPLRTAWGFDGAVVSDWHAARSLAATAEAGLDLVMPGPAGPWGDALVEAVEGGRISPAHIDQKVLNLLRVAARVGAIESLPVGRESADLDDDAMRRVLRRSAIDGTVLVRNDGVLPLDATALRRVAVIGDLAVRPRIQGGGSAEVRPASVVSPLSALRGVLGPDVAVEHVVGSYLVGDPDVLPPEVASQGQDGRVATVRWFGADGALVGEEARNSCLLVRTPTEMPQDAVAVEIRTDLSADVAGTWQVGFSGVGDIRFDVDGAAVHDGVVAADHDDPAAGFLTPPVHLHELALSAGQTVALRLSRTLEAGKSLSLAVRAQRPRRSAQDELELARRAARDADVAVVVVGTSAQIESEGFDRRDLALPDGQDELVSGVAEENPRTIVVVNAGAPVEVPWREEVSAILVPWFGGQEMGAALADVLLGRAEPGGRLPMTWPARTQDVPVLDTAPVDGQLVYGEGIHVGYRAWSRDGSSAPAYPFGHGLGYTSWELGEAEIRRHETGVTATIQVTNTGTRAGKQVVQAYLSRPTSGIERPARWLGGFAAFHADPGETGAVSVDVPSRAFAHWCEQRDRWEIEAGEFELAIGTSVDEMSWQGVVDAPEAGAEWGAPLPAEARGH